MAETSKASMELNDNNPSDSSSSGSEDSESERSGPVTSMLEWLRAPSGELWMAQVILSDRIWCQVVAL